MKKAVTRQSLGTMVVVFVKILTGDTKTSKATQYIPLSARTNLIKKCTSIVLAKCVLHWAIPRERPMYRYGTKTRHTCRQNEPPHEQ